MLAMAETAKRAAIATLVVGAIVVLALAFWKLRVVLALIFLAFIFAAAMRPTIEALRRHGIPRGVGLLLHYVIVLGAITAFLWLVVPRALTQVDKPWAPGRSSARRRSSRRGSGTRSSPASSGGSRTSPPARS